jgi:hypothetical protein
MASRAMTTYFTTHTGNCLLALKYEKRDHCFVENYLTFLSILRCPFLLTSNFFDHGDIYCLFNCLKKLQFLTGSK